MLGEREPRKIKMNIDKPLVKILKFIYIYIFILSSPGRYGPAFRTHVLLRLHANPFFHIQDGICRCNVFPIPFLGPVKTNLPVWFRKYIWNNLRISVKYLVYRNMCPDPFLGGWIKESAPFLFLIFWRDMVPMHWQMLAKMIGV